MEPLANYKKYLEARHLAAATIEQQIKMLKSFYEWLAQRHCDAYRDLRDLSLTDILAYKKHLNKPRETTGKPNSLGYQHIQLRSVKNYTAFLKERDQLLIDPCENLPVLRTPKTLPKGVLSNGQVMKLLRMCDLSDPFGFRDRTIIEMLFSCGLRGRELCRLTIYDPDFDKKMLRVLQAKGRKDRVVPIGKAALEYLREYIARVRPIILEKNQGNRANGAAALFLSQAGTPLRVDTLWKLIRGYRKNANLSQTVTTHSFRHACATEMLKGGASVRHVQEMLGHADISTTQIYTHLAKADLQKIHQKTAPSERRKDKAAPTFELTNWRKRKRKKKRTPRKEK
jgi:integrase/recombinase XerD